MELKTVDQMKTYLEAKFTSILYTATVTLVRESAKSSLFNITWSLSDGTPQPHLNGKVRCYSDGLTTIL